MNDVISIFNRFHIIIGYTFFTQLTFLQGQGVDYILYFSLGIVHEFHFYLVSEFKRWFSDDLMGKAS